MERNKTDAHAVSTSDATKVVEKGEKQRIVNGVTGRREACLMAKHAYGSIFSIHRYRSTCFLLLSSSHSLPYMPPSLASVKRDSQSVDSGSNCISCYDPHLRQVS